MTESNTTNQPIARYQIVNDRRLELLKMEGLGFNHSEIVKHLSSKYHCSNRNIHFDFEKRSRWQPRLQDFQNRVLTVWNRNEQIYQMAAMERVRATNENARIGALRIMALVNSTQAELCGANLQAVGSPETAVTWVDNIKQYDAALNEAAKLDVASRVAQMENKQDDSQ